MRALLRLALPVAVFMVGTWAVSGRAAPVYGSELHIGAATVSITPEQPVLLSGQLFTRVSQHVDSPLTASVLVLESRDGGKSLDQAIMVACDLVGIREGLIDGVRAELKKRLPDLDPQKVFLSATHTHTAPETIEGRYTLPDASVIMRPDAYSQFFTERVVTAIETAWRARRPGSVGWGLGHAVVGQNRLAVSDDGRSTMYGPTSVPTFARFEGYEDHGVEVLCCWDAEGKLIATAINVACPAQEVEAKSAIDADIWHPIRQALRDQHGEGLVVLGWTGAAGDQSPHLMFRKAAEERMRSLRRVDRLQEIARRVVAAWEEAYAGAVQEKHADATLAHRVQTLELPVRQVTQEESLAAKAKAAEVAGDPTKHFIWQWQQAVVARFGRQQPDDVCPVEIHVLRLGDVAIATNPFELYTDYGVQMKARSPALQTFVIQLAGPPGTYLPTDRAAAGGAYGAVAQSSTVGPAGGRVLVERTLETMGDLWPPGK
jgi:hypothetical protein